MYQVWVVGALSIDEVKTRSEEIRKIGGAVTYSGLTYQRLGVDCSIVSNFDASDPSLKAKFIELGIDSASPRGKHTTSFAIHVLGDGRDMSLLSQSDSIEPTDLGHLPSPEGEDRGHIHLGPLFSEDIEIESIEFLKSRGHLLGLDVQGFVRAIDGSQIAISAHKEIGRILKLVDYLKADLDELDCVLKALGLDKPEELLALTGIKELIVTAASKGGQVYSFDGWNIKYQPKEPENPDDSTGAGDVFFASYLSARLVDQKSIEESCKLAQETVILHLNGQHISQSELVLSSF